MTHKGLGDFSFSTNKRQGTSKGPLYLEGKPEWFCLVPKAGVVVLRLRFGLGRLKGLLSCRNCIFIMLAAFSFSLLCKVLESLLAIVTSVLVYVVAQSSPYLFTSHINLSIPSRKIVDHSDGLENSLGECQNAV